MRAAPAHPHVPSFVLAPDCPPRLQRSSAGSSPSTFPTRPASSLPSLAKTIGGEGQVRSPWLALVAGSRVWGEAARPGGLPHPSVHLFAPAGGPGSPGLWVTGSEGLGEQEGCKHPAISSRSLVMRRWRGGCPVCPGPTSDAARAKSTHARYLPCLTGWVASFPFLLLRVSFPLCWESAGVS